MFIIIQCIQTEDLDFGQFQYKYLVSHVYKTKIPKKLRLSFGLKLVIRLILTTFPDKEVKHIMQYCMCKHCGDSLYLLSLSWFSLICFIDTWNRQT